MREIKFRWWDIKNKIMFDVNHIDFINWITNQSTFNSQQCIFKWPHKEVILMQFTWLKDKNWKEIYEGDILRLYNEEYNNYELFIEVIFNYKACFFGKKIKNNTDDLWESDILYNYNLDITEIIWNIYENPELLNK